MSEAVLDASAVLALLNGEPGSEVVLQFLAEAAISTVNLAEVVARLSEGGMPISEIRTALTELDLEVHPFDSEQAWISGGLRPETKRLGLSLGDRCCLALGRALELPVVTADRTWAELDLTVEIRLIR